MQPDETRIITVDRTKNKDFIENEVRKSKAEASKLIEDSEGFLLVAFIKDKGGRVLSTVAFNQYMATLTQVSEWASIYADEQLKAMRGRIDESDTTKE